MASRLERDSAQSVKSKSFLALAFSLFLFSPFWVLILKFPLQINFDFEELIWAFKNTVYQSGLSALGSLVLGTWLAFGLVSLSPGWRRKAEILCLIPNFFPPLFVLLIVFHWVDPFPVGIWGVAFVHAIINFGLVAVSLCRSMEKKLGGLAEVSYIEGCTRGNFLRKIFFPLMRKEYLVLFLFVFSICFSSFSVPLIVGGGKGTTIEVLIYEKIRLSMDWGGAVLLSMVQLMVLAGLSLTLVRSEPVFSESNKEMRWVGHVSGVLLLVVFGILFVGGYVGGVWGGLETLSQFSELKSVLVLSTLGTLFIGLTTGFLVLTLLALAAYLHEVSYQRFFLRAYIAPSTTLTGFAFLVLGPNEGIISYFKVPFAMSLLFIGPLFRMGWETEVDRLQNQKTVADILGASPWVTFKKVVWPQIASRGLLLAGIAAAWACGDFAITRILAYKDMTLGLMTETLMSTYRLNMASLLSFGILVCGLICFFTFWGFRYVYRRKFI